MEKNISAAFTYSGDCLSESKGIDGNIDCHLSADQLRRILAILKEGENE